MKNKFADQVRQIQRALAAGSAVYVHGKRITSITLYHPKDNNAYCTVEGGLTTVLNRGLTNGVVVGNEGCNNEKSI